MTPSTVYRRGNVRRPAFDRFARPLERKPVPLLRATAAAAWHRYRAGGGRWARPLVGALAAFLVSTAGAAPQRIAVHAVNYPLAYFAEHIAGDSAEVTFPVPAGVDPAFWRPDADAVVAFQQADLILLNGAGYARWLDAVSLPRRKLVNTSAAFRDRYLDTQTALTHSHGLEGAHSHARIAFTTWLDFEQAAQQARAVRDALIGLRPDQEESFSVRYRALERDLVELDTRLREIAAREAGRPLLASHPVYPYLARRYGFDLKSVTWEPDVVPSQDEWKFLEALLADHPAQWMLWEARPVAQTAARLETLGVRSVVFHTGAGRPEGQDFLEVMRQNIQDLAASLQAHR